MAFLNLLKLTFSPVDTKSVLKRFPLPMLCYGTHGCCSSARKMALKFNTVIYGKGSYPHLPLPRNWTCEDRHFFERKDKAEVNFICMSQYRISFWKYCQATFLTPGKVTHSESSQERKLNRIKNGTGWGLKQEKEVRERKLDCLK